MYSFFLLFLLTGNPEPMNVLPGDPIIEAKIHNLSGDSFELKDVLDTSLCWFLSVDCGACQQAYTHINNVFAERYHTIVVFIDPKESVKAFLRQNPPETQIYVVDQAQLKPYAIKTVPALLLYRESNLSYAFHGPLHEEGAHKMVNWFEDRFKDM